MNVWIDFSIFFTVVQRASFVSFHFHSFRPFVRLRERRLGTVNHDTPTTENGKDNLRVIDNGETVVSHSEDAWIDRSIVRKEFHSFHARRVAIALGRRHNVRVPPSNYSGSSDRSTGTELSAARSGPRRTPSRSLSATMRFSKKNHSSSSSFVAPPRAPPGEALVEASCCSSPITSVGSSVVGRNETSSSCVVCRSARVVFCHVSRKELFRTKFYKDLVIFYKRSDIRLVLKYTRYYL